MSKFNLYSADVFVDDVIFKWFSVSSSCLLIVNATFSVWNNSKYTKARGSPLRGEGDVLWNGEMGKDTVTMEQSNNYSFVLCHMYEYCSLLGIPNMYCWRFLSLCIQCISHCSSVYLCSAIEWFVSLVIAFVASLLMPFNAAIAFATTRKKPYERSGDNRSGWNSYWNINV